MKAKFILLVSFLLILVNCNLLKSTIKVVARNKSNVRGAIYTEAINATVIGIQPQIRHNGSNYTNIILQDNDGNRYSLSVTNLDTAQLKKGSMFVVLRW